jgi:hypothetical protein
MAECIVSKSASLRLVMPALEAVIEGLQVQEALVDLTSWP